MKLKMKQQQQPPLQNDYQIEGIFCLPVYTAKRDSELNSTEEKEIEDVIEEGMYNPGEDDSSGENLTSHNSYIFNTKLKKIKQFCEKHIDTYAKEILNPKEETNYYITQSWLGITKPGQWHPHDRHSNSIISGVFYISTEEDDKLVWINPNNKEHCSQPVPRNFNIWNTPEWPFTVKNNLLLLFPSWMVHYVPINPSARSKPRITIAFNTFAKGRFGVAKNRNELILS